MDYEHDIFISYRREENWTSWTRDLFCWLLRSYLQQDLSRTPKIFVDERLEVGSDWVHELATHLARSRVVVAIFSGDYFASPWCLHELDLIIERQQATANAHSGILIPLIAHDGDLIPTVVDRTLHRDVSPFRRVGFGLQNPRFGDFSDLVHDVSKEIARRILAAPPFDEAWIEHHKARFDAVFEAAKRKELHPTTMFPIPDVPKPLTGPKLNPKLP